MHEVLVVDMHNWKSSVGSKEKAAMFGFSSEHHVIEWMLPLFAIDCGGSAVLFGLVDGGGTQ
ncbi:hypothetical protein [Alcaligenes aquatilis]|uniref:hypothetical protein n=1 Tax=Alcaligenes aquatilis TaxID=323284 RepID=UPI0013CF0C41|nr:hypothetical protein [Alcaligenes aquatilis]